MSRRCLSCLLLNIALGKPVYEVDINTRGTIINKSVKLLAYADDIDLIARSKRNFIQAFTKLETVAKRVSLQINTLNTKYMKVMIRTLHCNTLKPGFRNRYF